MKFKYEIVTVGTMPTFAKENTQEFTVPVAIGEKIISAEEDAVLKRVVEIEHYPKVSILYVE